MNAVMDIGRFAAVLGPARGQAGRDRDRDARALAARDLPGAVAAVHARTVAADGFADGSPSRVLLDATLDALGADQQARWGEGRTRDLLAAFLPGEPREDLPVADLFAHSASWAHATAAGDPVTYFDEPDLAWLQGWMDSVNLAQALGLCLGDRHAAAPLAHTRNVLGSRRYARVLDALGLGATGVLEGLRDVQWSHAYALLSQHAPSALRPEALDRDALLNGLAAALCDAREF